MELIRMYALSGEKLTDGNSNEAANIRCIQNVKIPFCEKCEVELRSCYLGQNDALRTSLQSMFPCEIVLYGTPVFGYGAIYGFQYLYQKLFN